jgi:hypothetical protein
MEIEPITSGDEVQLLIWQLNRTDSLLVYHHDLFCPSILYAFYIGTSALVSFAAKF